MKTNPLRLPLYILYTLKQGKIFQSRRIKSTVIAYKAILFYYEETTKYSTILRKPQSGKVEPFLWEKKKWLTAQDCAEVPESIGLGRTVWRRDRPLVKLQPVSQLTRLQRTSPPAPLLLSIAHHFMLFTSLLLAGPCSTNHK